MDVVKEPLLLTVIELAQGVVKLAEEMILQ